MPQNTYQLITLTSNISLQWPSAYGSGTALLDINNVTTAQDGYTITFPNATLVNNGISTIFNNISGFSFSLLAYDGITILTTIASGEIFNLYLTDNSTSNGTWGVIPFGSGTASITTFTAESSDSSIQITNGTVVSPSGTINFQLPTSLYNLDNVSTTGFLIITADSPLQWQTTTLTAGDNITISNGDGISGAPVINVSSNIVNLSSLVVGDITLTSNTIEPTNANDNLVLSTSGTGDLYLNGVIIDPNSNISAINNLIVSGTFDNPLMAKARVRFSDSAGTIAVIEEENITSVTGSGGVYQLTFQTAAPNADYSIYITTFTNSSTDPLVTHAYPVDGTLSTSAFSIAVVDASGVLVAELPDGISVLVYWS